MSLYSLSGQMGYDSAANEVAGAIMAEKSSNYQGQVMVVGVEGLSNSGKTTLATALESKLNADSYSPLLIEGDKFIIGKMKAMEVYSSLISSVTSGEDVPENFPELIWRCPVLQQQIFEQVSRFNGSSLDETTLELYDVLDETKIDGSEHDKTYPLTRESIILVPLMFIRQFKPDFVVYLDITPDTSIKRKINRDVRIGFRRDPSVTRKMVELIENPAMAYHIQQNPLTSGIALDVNDFTQIKPA